MKKTMDKERVFRTSDNEYDISVYPESRGSVQLGMNMGCESFFATLTSSEVETLISMLKKAKKESMGQ